MIDLAMRSIQFRWIEAWLSKRKRESPHFSKLHQNAHCRAESHIQIYQITQQLTHCRSGELNAKHRELLELQALAQSRLKGTRANFADGMKAAKEVKRDLEWTQKRVT